MNSSEIVDDIIEMLPHLKIGTASSLELIPFLISEGFLKIIAGEYCWTIKDFDKFKEEADEWWRNNQ